MKVLVVLPEPTPYRAPLLDRLTRRSEIELAVVYAARTVADRTWSVELRHPHVFLRGWKLPGVRRILRHDYPVTPGILRILGRERPDVVVVSGWSMFASQVAILWCRLWRVPYLVIVESHDRDPRPGWRRAVKWAVVPRMLRPSAGALVTGSLARQSMIRAGIPENRIWRFANTVDTAAFADRAAILRPERGRLREELGLGDGAVAALTVCRLVPEKALDIFLRAAAGIPDLVPVIVGEGPERPELERLARELSVPAVFVGDIPWERIVELYAAADVFVLLSRHEPWGVVVNEAAACGLPLVLSDHVGAGEDLLAEGRNGIGVPVDDPEATRAALLRLAGDPGLRTQFGRCSAELARDWGYEPSVEGFLAGIGEAAR